MDANQESNWHNRPALAPLIVGYKQFRANYFHQDNSYEPLVKYGQQPKVLIIACCDSRVDPAIVTNSKPGELFVVRNVANLVPPFDGNPSHHGTSAALEFGVLELGVSDIIIFGHSHCGGITALMEKEHSVQHSDFIDAWMDIAQPAKNNTLKQHPDSPLAEQVHYCAQESLLISLHNLTTFPWIEERVLANNLALHAWFFNLDTGVIEAYDVSREKFFSL